MRCRDVTLGLPLLLMLGCEPPDPPEDPVTLPLVQADAWARLTNEDLDVFAGERPDDAVCDDEGYFVDPIKQVLEIETELCDYLTAHQPTLEPIEVGDTVEVWGYHDLLLSDEPAEGYFGLAIDGQVLWEYRVDIPSGPMVIGEEFVSDRDFSSGSDIQVHIHNHGPNTWEVVALRVTHPGG